jgi:hypothetical protein
MLSLSSLLPTTLFWLTKISSIDIYQATENSIEEYESEIFSEPKRNINSFLRDVIQQVPLITIQNGIAVTESLEPIFIYDPYTKNPLIIIDTTGQTTSLNNSRAIMLLTRKEIFIKPWWGEQKVIHYFVSELLGNKQFLTIDHNMLFSWIAKGRATLLWSIPLIMLPIALLAAFSFALIKAGCYAFVAQLLLKPTSISLSFKALLRLAIISTVPYVAVSALFDWFMPGAIGTFYYRLLTFALSSGYFYFAIKSCLKEE